MKILFLTGVTAAMLVACSTPPRHDVVIRNATIHDGSGGRAVTGDIAIDGDRIAVVGDLGPATGAMEIDASGLVAAPGFINMLSWSTVSLIEDGRSQGEIRQGVTTQIFGEGWSMGPLNEAMKEEMVKRQDDIKYEITWTTLDEYLEHLVERGISPNVASFIGATTARIHVLGYEDRAPDENELERMRSLVREAMEDGALGVGSSLIYAPAFYAGTDELVELSRVASEYGGMYITHMRSEGNRLLEAVDEVITIARDADIAAEIYHLKAAGRENWPKMEEVITRVESARAEGLRITADMYTYTAGATGLNATMPPWVQEGGHDAWVERLRDAETRQRVAREMATPTDKWENLLLAAGSAEQVLLVSFRNDDLKHLTGTTLAEVASMRGKSPEQTAIELVIEDDSRVGTVFFLMSEENIRRQIALPWMSFGSDEASQAPEGVFLRSNPHPRAYGNFSRLLGRYVREEGIIPLAEAIRKLTSLPAGNLGLKDRGLLTPGFFADIVLFDPETIADHATYDEPHRYVTGMVHVFVNGRRVLAEGEHTGATPGRVLRGPGWRGHASN